MTVGDTVRVTLRNPDTNQLPHSIDFHASLVAWNDEMRSINPGEELVYEFEAKYAGVFMYHCGTTPALHHIASGMFGMIIVEPAGGLAPVDHEFALIQSEWYLGEQAGFVSLEKASAAAPAPEYVVWNGVATQYAEHPIEVPVGETVRVFVLNAGPSIDSSFHVVGTVFDQVIKEGSRCGAGTKGTGARRPSTCHRRRAPSWRCTSTRTACTPSLPTPSTSSAVVRLACSRPATAVRRRAAPTGPA